MEHLLVPKTLGLEGALTQKHYEGRIQSAVNICISDEFSHSNLGLHLAELLFCSTRSIVLLREGGSTH